MRLSPLKNSSSAAAAAVGRPRAAPTTSRALLSTSAAALKSFAAPASPSSDRNGVVAQATASMSNGYGAAARRRTRGGATTSSSSSSPPFRLSRDHLSPLRALPTATSPSEASSPRRQRSPKVTTTSSAVPAPPSLQQRQSSPSSSSTLMHRAPLPAPPVDGAPLAHEIIKGSMVSGRFVVLDWRIRARKREKTAREGLERGKKATVLVRSSFDLHPPPQKKLDHHHHPAPQPLPRASPAPDRRPRPRHPRLAKEPRRLRQQAPRGLSALAGAAGRPAVPRRQRAVPPDARALDGRRRQLRRRGRPGPLAAPQAVPGSPDRALFRGQGRDVDG